MPNMVSVVRYLFSYCRGYGASKNGRETNAPCEYTRVPFCSHTMPATCATIWSCRERPRLIHQTPSHRERPPPAMPTTRGTHRLAGQMARRMAATVRQMGPQRTRCTSRSSVVIRHKITTMRCDDAN